MTKWIYDDKNFVVGRIEDVPSGSGDSWIEMVIGAIFILWFIFS